MKKITAAIMLVMSLGLTACGSTKAEVPEVEAEVEAPEVEAEAEAPEVETETEVAEAEVQTETDGSAMDADTTAQAQTEDTEAVSDREANFDVDKKDYMEYGQRIKDAVAAKDLEALADLTAFPVYLGLGDGVIVETKDDFLAYGVDEIFTQEMIDSIEKANVADLGPSMAGFTLMGSMESVPSITFSIVNGNLAVTGINY